MLKRPRGSIRLRMKNQTGGTAVLSLGEFGPEAAEEIYWDVDLDKFYDPADIQPMETEWDYQVIFPEGSNPGRIAAWEEILGYDHTVLRLDNSNEETGVYYYHIVPKRPWRNLIFLTTGYPSSMETITSLISI